MATATTASPAPGPATLAVDIGGTGVKASVLDAAGAMLTARVRVATGYPCSPGSLLAQVEGLVGSLPPFDRVGAGFPGVVRAGKVLTAPHFVAVEGPEARVDHDLLAAWTGFDLAGALAAALGKPARVQNDAEVQGLYAIAGKGVELVITLGTGVGTAVFADGRSSVHLELGHHPFRKGQTYDEQLGDPARRRVGDKKWNKRLVAAIANFAGLFEFDALYIGGGNARHITASLGPTVSMIDPDAGILGGIKLWEEPPR